MYKQRTVGPLLRLLLLLPVSLPQERSMAEQVFYTWIARSRSGSSSFTASALDQLPPPPPPPPGRYEIFRKAKIGFEILLGKKDGKRV